MLIQTIETLLKHTFDQGYVYASKTLWTLNYLEIMILK